MSNATCTVCQRYISACRCGDADAEKKRLGETIKRFYAGECITCGCRLTRGGRECLGSEALDLLNNILTTILCDPLFGYATMANDVEIFLKKAGRL